jgi:hypothetical protein
MHYKNGREAKVGDHVVGYCYNTKGAVAGTLVSLTPGPDNCSAMVAFISLKAGSTPLDWGVNKPVHVMGTAEHGAKEPLAAQVHVMDYTHCANLLHADDAAQAVAVSNQAGTGG